MHPCVMAVLSLVSLFIGTAGASNVHCETNKSGVVVIIILLYFEALASGCPEIITGINQIIK